MQRLKIIAIGFLASLFSAGASAAGTGALERFMVGLASLAVGMGLLVICLFTLKAVYAYFRNRNAAKRGERPAKRGSTNGR